MNREEQLKFCKVCVNRKMDISRGLLCGLTNEKADFEESCPDYKEDVEAKNQTFEAGQYVNDELHPGLKVLAFCVPLAGAIMYFVHKDKFPNKAKSACTLALIGFGFGLVLRVLLTIATQ